MIFHNTECALLSDDGDAFFVWPDYYTNIFADVTNLDKTTGVADVLGRIT